MAGFTEHYGLQKIGQGDSFSENSYKFTSADRDTVDQLVYLGAEAHHHTGGASSTSAPVTGLTLTLDTTQGALAAGTRYYYVYTYVDGNGIETTISPEVWIDTPPPVTSPAAATLSNSSFSGGSLLPGNYYYALSAYTGSTNYETLADSPAYIAVPTGTTTNVITLTLPTLPSGASGFNIYRKTPSGAAFYFIGSIDCTVTTPTSVDDDGVTYLENCDRLLPVANTTTSTNAVNVQIPSLPDGSSWRLYRTGTTGSYTNSYLTVRTTTAVYEDLGAGTTTGQPPTTSVTPGNPSKIQLTDGAEVQGSLPPSMVAYPLVVTFGFPGPLALTQGASVWTCECPHVEVVGVRASLGRGSTPASTAVKVDVLATHDAGAHYTSIFNAATPAYPTVPPGAQIGARVAPSSQTVLNAGDAFAVDIVQVGGGATPTDNDLTVNVYMVAYGFPTASFAVPGSTAGW